MAASSPAQRPTAALSVALAVAPAACGVNAGACSIGSGIRQRDLTQSYRSSDEVHAAGAIALVMAATSDDDLELILRIPLQSEANGP